MIFFLFIERERLQKLTVPRLIKTGGNIPGQVSQELIKSKNVVHAFSNVHKVEFTDVVDEHLNVSAILPAMKIVINNIVDHSIIMSEVRQKTTHLYLKTAFKQFRSEVLVSEQVKKKEAHRINIMKRKEKVRAKKKTCSPKTVVRASEENAPVACQFVEEDFCEVCLQKEQDNEEWVMCDGCLAWFHRQCGGIIHENLWRDICEQTPWLCKDCVGRLDEMEGQH